MIVLDTHVWIWWLSNPENLSKKASNAINLAMPANSIYVSSISIWEVATLVKKGRLYLKIDVNDWVKLSESLPFINFVPVNNYIALKSVNLPEKLHEDPADRIIIATSLSLGTALVSKDKRLLEYKHIDTIW